MVSFYKTNKICTTILCDTKAVFVLTSNHFRKCFSVNEGVWLHMENKFSRSYLKLTEKMSLWPRKWFEDQFFTSNHFRIRRAEREREREREREPRSRLQCRRWTPSSSLTIACTRSHAPVWRLHALVRWSRGSPDRTLQSDDQEEAQIARSSPTIERKPRSHALVWRSISPSILPSTHQSSTHRSLSMILIFVVVVVW